MSRNRIKNSNSVELSFNVVGALAGLKLKVKSQRLVCQDFCRRVGWPNARV